MKKVSNEELLAELEMPFPVDQVLWRVTNTANNRTRGQVVPYADPRAYSDRLNALVSPQGWTRGYETATMNNITRTSATPRSLPERSWLPARWPSTDSDALWHPRGVGG